MPEFDRFSHSQLRAWNECRMKWHLQYARRLEPNYQPLPFYTGITVHEILEHFYLQKMEGRSLTWDELSIWIRNNFELPKSDEQLQAFAHINRVMRRYVTDYSPVIDKDWTPVHVEQKGEYLLTTPNGNEVSMVYIPDVIMRHSSGKLWIWDHKTFKSKPFSDGDLMTEIQIPIYIGAVREDLGLDIHGAVFNMLNVYPYKKYEEEPLSKLFVRKRAFRTPTEIDNTINLIGAQIDDLRANSDKIFMNLRKDCSWCMFNDFCTMTMKGMDGEEILSSNFKERSR